MCLRYLGIPPVETINTGRWSIPEAANAIKAIFFLESIGQERVPSLRYSRIREALRREEKPISPRTLSRALDLLELRKEVIREEIGRQVRYSLVLDPSREETIYTWANADSMLVQGAARVGGIGDREVGWAFYGLPFSMKFRLRFRLKTEVEEFQDRVDGILEDEANRLIRSILLKARGRVPKQALAAGEHGLWAAFERMATTGLFQVLALTGLAALERFAPGAVSMIIEKIGQGLPKDSHKALVEVAKKLGESEADVEKELRKAEDDGKAIDSLLTGLSPRDREDAARRFGALLATRANLCAVVR
jgi:hypothetical protein